MTSASQPVAHPNAPYWNPRGDRRGRQSFQEQWYLKVNDPQSQQALWLRFNLLVSHNGFRRIAETWAVFFERDKASRDVSKVALKQTYDISAFHSPKPTQLQLGECELVTDEKAPDRGRTRGNLRSKGNTLEWDLDFGPAPASPARTGAFSLVPEWPARFGFLQHRVVTASENLRFSGRITVNGRTYEWKDAPGMQGHATGSRSGHSWVWGHCNSFTTEQGTPVDFVFEGLSGRARWLGSLAAPSLSAFYFLYNGEEYHFNSLWSVLRTKSRHSLADWEFQADAGPLSFRGRAKAEHKDFAGLTYEDTDGSLLYCAGSRLSELRIHIYRRGKLEAALQANGTAAIDIVSRQKNPYVPLLL